MSDHYLIRDQQLAAKIESSPGVAETLTAAEVKLKPFQSDTPYTPDYLRFTNDEVSDDIAEAADFVGGFKGTIGLGFLLKSSGTVGTPGGIDVYLRACGCQADVVHVITIGAISGGDNKFEAGAAYSATGGKTGTIEAERNGAGALRYIVGTGGALASGDTVTVGADSGTTSSADALYAVRYTPRSTGHETLTIQRAEKNDAGTSAKDYLYKLRGAVGNARIEMAPLDVPRFRGEFQGVVASMGNGSFLTGYTYETGTPPTFANATCQINGQAIQVADVNVDFGNEIAMEPDPTTIGGAAGYDYARIVRRVPTIELAPYRLITTELDDLGLLSAGTAVPVVLSFGTTPQLMELQAPLCQIRSWTPADRAGRRVAQLTLTCTRATVTDTDWALYMR